MLRGLQTGPAITVETEGQAVEARHFDDEPTIGLEKVTRRLERLDRIVVVLEKVPHRDESEALVAEVLLVKQTAAKVDSAQSRMRAQILEVHARESRAITRPHLLEERPDGTADVEHVAVR